MIVQSLVLFSEIGLPKLILLHFVVISGMANPKNEGSIFSDIVMVAILDFKMAAIFHRKVTITVLL